MRQKEERQREREEVENEEVAIISSLSLISGPWGTEAVQIAGPQLLRNAASHSSLLFPRFCKITSSLSDHGSCENTSWLTTCQKRPG